MRSLMCQDHKEAGENKDEAGEAGKRVLGRAGHFYQELGLSLKGSGSGDGM